MKNWLIQVVAVFSLFSIFIFLLGWYTRDQTIDPVIVDRVVIKEVPYQMRGENTLTAEEALALIVWLKSSHSYMIANPKEQDARTGDTEFNQSVVTMYDSISNLIKWQANKLGEK